MVSVCMATYNGEKFIYEQLKSILAQLSDKDEVIISDDGSTDNTIGIIHSFLDNRLKIFYNKAHHGVIPNFENALKYASGDYIFLCDQDDIWEKDKVASCVKKLEDNILVLHDACLINSEGEIFENSYFQIRGSKIGYINNLIKNSYLGCCMAFRKELLPYLLPFPKRIEMHDRWIGLQAELNGRTFLENKCLSRYRIHGNNVSNSTQRSTNDYLTMLSIRWWLFFYTTLYKFKSTHFPF